MRARVDTMVMLDHPRLMLATARRLCLAASWSPPALRDRLVDHAAEMLRARAAWPRLPAD
jgi:hypothetical protein